MKPGKTDGPIGFVHDGSSGDRVPADILDLVQRDQRRVAAFYDYRRMHLPQQKYSWLNAGNLVNHQEQQRFVASALSVHCPDVTKIRLLDVGCGGGTWIREFILFGMLPENLFGVDVLPERAAEARRLSPSAVTFVEGNAARLPFPDDSFDIVFQSTVFSSVLDPIVRQKIASEMLRVLLPGGLVLWYDFHANIPGNRFVVGIRRREIHALFPSCRIELRRLTLLPPLARILGPISPVLVMALAAPKVLCTHYFGIFEKPTQAT